MLAAPAAATAASAVMVSIAAVIIVAMAPIASMAPIVSMASIASAVFIEPSASIARSCGRFVSSLCYFDLSIAVAVVSKGGGTLAVAAASAAAADRRARSTAAASAASAATAAARASGRHDRRFVEPHAATSASLRTVLWRALRWLWRKRPRLTRAPYKRGGAPVNPCAAPADAAGGAGASVATPHATAPPVVWTEVLITALHHRQSTQRGRSSARAGY